MNIINNSRLLFGIQLLIMGHVDFDLTYIPEHMFCWVSCHTYCYINHTFISTIIDDLYIFPLIFTCDDIYYQANSVILT